MFHCNEGKEGGKVNKKDIESKVSNMVQPIIDENTFELVDVEYIKEGSNWYLRVYVDKEGGIDIDDCVLVSRALEAKLDEDDFIQDAYILEVSSPGLTRPLKKDNDFRRNLGKQIEVRLYKAVDGRKEFEAKLTGYDADTITVELADTQITYNRNDIAMIRLAFEF